MARGLYIHIPFCIKKCSYCDFVSFAYEDKDAYLDALCSELDLWRGESVDSIFIGGGTPSCLSAAQMERLFSYINSCFTTTPDCEWSIEANPKTLDAEKLTVMRNAGCNRLSVGVQSFSDKELLRIGRAHSAHEAAQTLELARRAGFDNINIDLMSALPGQSIESFGQTLDEALAFEPEHISCYSLILEEGTLLYEEERKGTLELPDEETERAMYALAQKKLAGAGYIQYEISNFAKPNRECKHNLKYWRCEEYIGAGLAAHSYIGGERFYNTDDMQQYLSGTRTAGGEKLTEDDMRAEFIIMALRLREGISEREFRKRFGMDFYESYRGVTDRFISLGLMEKTNDGFRLTDDGICVSNSVMCEYV